jgi:hypothetical protein
MSKRASGSPKKHGGIVTINLAIGPVVALIAGVLILIVPRLLNYIVAIYLIIIGLIGLFGWSGTHIHSTATDRAPVLAAPVTVATGAAAPPAIARSVVVARA